MMRTDTFLLVLSFIALVLLVIALNATADESTHFKGIIGAIIDESSRIGKEERIAMEIAMEDFNQTLVLHIKDSRGQPISAALAAKDLIHTKQVQAILGPQTWEEVSLVADISIQNQIPILSSADNSPKWATERYPFLVQASPNKDAQMKVIAAIVQSWNWHQVTVLYQDSMADGVLSHLYDSLREVGAEIRQVVSLSPFASSSLSRDLEQLKTEECRVFIVHASSLLAARLFRTAKKMEMMEEDYVWIATDPVTSLVHSLNASIISSMQGILGVKSYFPETSSQFQDFHRRFRSRFSRRYSKENNNYEPGIFAVQAYDAFRTMALAIREGKYKGNELLEQVLLTDFDGLSGKVQFMNKKLAPTCKFQIINIIGRSYRELGFWSNGKGFSKSIDENGTDSSSMAYLGQILWPGGTSHTPKGWTQPATSANPLRIGVPSESGYKEYVKVENNSLTGFAIEVFNATVKRLPFNLPCKFIAFNGTYNELVEQIHLKKFDAVVGDVAIFSHRYQHAEFTHPYTETGLMMVVPTQSKSCNAWLFLKPFTKPMWVIIAAITVYNGFVIWLIERSHCPELQGSILNQIGVWLWLSFTTLFSLHGRKLHSNLSRMAMVAWLFVALVITQTYTANLASVLTVQRLEPAVVDSNAMIGYCSRSFVKKYLVEVLKYEPHRLKNYGSIEEYGQALKSKEIAAAFLEAPLAKLFFAKYCKGFVKVGPTYKVGGFGFAFPRGSSLLASMNEALLSVIESGELLKLEKDMLESNDKCIGMESEDESPSLDPACFRVPFMITGIISTGALLFYILHRLNSMLQLQTLWKLMLQVIKHWNFGRKRFNRIEIEMQGNSFPNSLHP